MAIEIERKFWVQKLPECCENIQPIAIEQGYVALSDDGREVRLRKKGEAFFLTVKSAGTMQRSEHEVELSAAQFEALWPTTEDRRLQKDRYVLTQNAHTIEIDVYHQPLKGLIVAEVEFPSPTAAENYQVESWMSHEITHLNFLKNKNLLQFASVKELAKLL